MLLKQFADELERMLKRHKTELHKEEKNSLQDEIKFQKHFEQQQQAYMKNFVAQQAKTLKYTKQDLKDVCCFLLKLMLLKLNFYRISSTEVFFFQVLVKSWIYDMDIYYLMKLYIITLNIKDFLLANF